MNKSHSLESFTSELPVNRQLLASKLQEKAWFNSSSAKIQKELLTLPQNWEGFLYDITEREDNIGKSKIVNLSKISIGEYLAIAVFEITTGKGKQTIKREYVSWCHGKRPGVKGLILIKSGSKITHFVTTKDNKFPIGHATFDAIGGLTQYSAHQVTDSISQINNSIKKKLNLTNLKINDIYDLGRLETDNGMSPNHPGIFAVSILTEDFTAFAQLPNVDIIPIGQLDQYISKVDDSFFLAIIARLLAKKIISL